MNKKNIHQIKQLFIEEFSSVKLAITLFIFLAITTLIGTILPEEPMVGSLELIKRYGRQKYLILKSLGLTDVFHSWWYLALLTTLGINLIVASFKRVFPRAYIAFQWPMELREESIKKLPINCELDLNDKNNLNLNKIESSLRKKRYKAKINNKSLIAVKGGWHRLGASVTHVGILTLLIGCAVSTLTGFNGMAQISENEGFYLADLGQSTTQIKSTEERNWLAPISKMPIWLGKIPPYLVNVNKTWREDYETGQPKQWYTDLSILDQNKNVLARKTIHVNDPLEFMGLDIYQSNWGKFAQISFNSENASVPVETFMGEEVIFLPLSDDIGIKLKLVQTQDQNTNQGDVLELYSIFKDSPIQKFLGKVNVNQKTQIGPMNIGYFGTNILTGLQFKSNPGGFLIYPGLFFIICGVFIAFGSKKQIWASINAENNKIIIGGNSDRAKGKFFEEFEKLISELIQNK
ncbi:MAG: hypothetical protein A3B68_01130 [Candidatus Melainabacteria bacterium RIFCSPHIGHO2_02_FULL_34_12]|nr:MAG: hypothetical protein A3B68_01130 [Candidatus Melainabacteria bacterium RIFCSPHIGHO2_02_FULL_34_12]